MRAEENVSHKMIRADRNKHFQAEIQTSCYNKENILCGKSGSRTRMTDSKKCVQEAAKYILQTY